MLGSKTDNAPLRKEKAGVKIDARRKKARLIYERLKRAHPSAKIELNFNNPVELLVATILSAQCTDLKVNQVTPAVFKRYKQPEDYFKGSPAELEKLIRQTGFFRQKAKSIRGAMEKIVNIHGGKVPAEMDLLTALPGVGRKTANVILGNAFDIPGMPVDTHVIRIGNRLGLTKQTDPVKIERELTELIPARNWTHFSHVMIFHGRRVCKARKPMCENCTVVEVCDYYNKVVKKGLADVR